ncbi:hypothetical protein BKA65DRAFT_573280 [Rhexocercosporidium sp. MPI-PUGE-AT-0058]|nr:hypothetical protein BKA65DRAFT_573280 [Rhexocercosporidium sp. MPI-PUGE-AT-0058]
MMSMSDLPPDMSDMIDDSEASQYDDPASSNPEGSQASDANSDGREDPTVANTTSSVRQDDKFKSLTRPDYEERIKIRKGYCDLSDEGAPSQRKFKNFSIQWMNGTMTMDFVEEDGKGDASFSLSFKNGLIDNNGEAFLGFHFSVAEVREGYWSKPYSQVYGWAKLRTGVDGCPPAVISQAEKQRLDGEASAKAVKLEADLLGIFGHGVPARWIPFSGV